MESNVAVALENGFHCIDFHHSTTPAATVQFASKSETTSADQDLIRCENVALETNDVVSESVSSAEVRNPSRSDDVAKSRKCRSSSFLSSDESDHLEPQSELPSRSLKLIRYRFETVVEDGELTRTKDSSVGRSTVDFSSYFSSQVLCYEQCVKFADVEVMCADGTSSFQVNSVVFASWSPLLHRVLCDIDAQSPPQRPLIVLDDVSNATLQQLVSLFYSGSVADNGDECRALQTLLTALRVRDDGDKFHLLDLVDRPTRKRKHEQTTEVDIELPTEPKLEVPDALAQQLLEPQVSLNVEEGGNAHNESSSFAFEKSTNDDDDVDDNTAFDIPEPSKTSELDAKPLVRPALKKKKNKMKRRLIARRKLAVPSNDDNSVAVAASVDGESCNNSAPGSNQKPRYRFRKKNPNRTCHLCQKVFCTSYAVKKHIRNTHSTETVQCELCEKQFKSKHHLYSHKTTTHSTDNVQCDICSKTYKSKKDLHNHKLTHLEEKRHVCRFCGQGFNRKDRWETHEKIHNGMTFDCESCRKQFISILGLQRHVCGSTPKPHLCNICGKGYILRSKLEEHLNTHKEAHEQKVFACKHCGKTFALESSWKIHVSNHTAMKRHVCELCGSAFLQRGGLTTHMFLTHNVGEKRFLCGYCPSVFHANSALQTHVRTHTGEKPFGCDQCSERFISSSQRSTHMTSAHGHTKRSSECTFCSARFRTKKKLIDHIARKHPSSSAPPAPPPPPPAVASAEDTAQQQSLQPSTCTDSVPPQSAVTAAASQSKAGAYPRSQPGYNYHQRPFVGFERPFFM